MKFQIILLACLVALSYSAAPQTWTDAVIYPVAEESEDSYKQLAQDTDFVLKYGPDTDDDSIIWFLLTANSQGWISLGLASGAKMVNFDAAVFTYDQSTINLDDRWSLMATTPSPDSQTNDLTLDNNNSSYSNDQWSVQWYRQLNTQDDEDLQIYCGDNAAALATSGTQTFQDNAHTLIQFTNIAIDETQYTCNQIPEGYRDWLNPEESSNEDDDDDDDEDDEEYTQNIQLSILLLFAIVLSLI